MAGSLLAKNAGVTERQRHKLAIGLCNPPGQHAVFVAQL